MQCFVCCAGRNTPKDKSVESGEGSESQDGEELQSVQESLSIYDQAREHRPKLRMKKFRWDKVCLCISMYMYVFDSEPDCC